jgi:hypothetical protein
LGFREGFFFPWVCSKLRDREKAASTRTRKRTASRRNTGRGRASYFRSSSNDDDEKQRREFDYYLGLVSSCSEQPVRVYMNYWYSSVVLLMAKVAAVANQSDPYRNAWNPGTDLTPLSSSKIPPSLIKE